MPAGYSGTPLVTKLGIKPRHVVAILGAPDGFVALLEGLPQGVTLRTSLRGTAPLDLVIAVATRMSDLQKRVAAARTRITPAGAIWCTWPKKASGVPTDITEDLIRPLAFENRLVDNKVCAIDATWSGLRLVIRLADRPPGA